jgi:hypothetical protein
MTTEIKSFKKLLEDQVEEILQKEEEEDNYMENKRIIPVY